MQLGRSGGHLRTRAQANALGSGLQAEERDRVWVVDPSTVAAEAVVEQVMGAAPHLLTILRSCPSVRVLVISGAPDRASLRRRIARIRVVARRVPWLSHLD